MGSYVMNVMDYKYKLRSVIGREDNFTLNKWSWFDTQVGDTFLWSQRISQALVDYTGIREIIGCIHDNVYKPSLPIKDSIGPITLYFHISMIVYSGSNNHLQIRNFIHGNMLSSSLKKQRIGKVSLNNSILSIRYNITIDMLMNYLYVAVQYFYITNWLISGNISKVMYKPTKIMKSDYFIQTIQGKLIDINKFELTKVNSIEIVGSKWVRL